MAKKIKLIGDWNKVNAITRNLERVGKETMKQGLALVGLFAEGRAKSHISKQDLGWVPLKRTYLRSKQRGGFSTNILVKTSAYFQSITSYVIKDTAYVGVKKVVRNKEGKEIANIAAVHEFGSTKAKIPARPLWQPTLEETATWVKTNTIFEKLIEKKLKKFL